MGFLAGLLGIGGGLIIVPALLYILPWVGITSSQLTHVAIATSLSTIILTSLSSATAHHKRGNIPWPLFKPILPGIIIGALSAGFVSELIPSDQLQQAFAVFVVLMALQMAFPFKSKGEGKMPGDGVLFFFLRWHRNEMLPKFCFIYYGNSLLSRLLLDLWGGIEKLIEKILCIH